MFNKNPIKSWKIDIFCLEKQHFRSEKFLECSLSRYPSDLDRCTWSIEALHELLESRPGALQEILKFLFGGVDGLLVRLLLSDWNKQAEAHDTSHVRDLWTKITHATCYTMDTTTVGDPFGCPPSIFQRWQALSRSWSSTSPAPCHSPSSW